MWKNFKEKTLYRQVVIIVILVALLYMIITNMDVIFYQIGRFLRAISPFIVGGAIAYLLNKPAMGIRNALEKSDNGWVVKRAQTLSVVLVFLLLIAGISVVINIAIPIIDSNVRHFADNVTSYYNIFVDMIVNLDSGDLLYGLIPDLDGLLELITPELVNQVGGGAVQIVGHIMNITAWIFNLFLAIIAAFYILMTKESILALTKRLMRMFMNDSTYENVVSYAAKANRIFYRFVGAQFLDACILGTLATIILALLGVPYAVVFGILLGICNMIPIFGSIFATIVTTLVTIFTGGLTLAIVTFVALLILQQVDANFIGPKITGDALGLKPLLIIFAIIIGGHYGRIVGMFIAVPIAALLKVFLEDFMDARERKLRLKEEGEKEEEKEEIEAEGRYA